MNMKPVNSSNIQAIGYDPASKRLGVAFHGSGTYHHDEVPPELHEQLMAATDSHGKFYHANIKGKFKHTKADA
jgi:hypothetical protein